MAKITSISGREIMTSGGYPTIETTVVLADGSTGTASVAYGASTGSQEAHIMLDGDQSRYEGRGMLKAISNIETIIAPLLIGQEASEQQKIDQLMIDKDGTKNKSRLGGNAILAVSMAVARAASTSAKLELYQYLAQTYKLESKPNFLPRPMMVMIEGGKHGQQSTDIQEYLITIEDDQGPAENVRRALAVYQEVGKLLIQAGYQATTGNEGAWAPTEIKNNELPLEIITSAISQAGLKPGEDIALAIDAAASEFYQAGIYTLATEDQKLNAGELLERYHGWVNRYPLKSIEDPLSEFDWANWPSVRAELGGVNIITDDITVTNKKLLQQGLEQKIGNGIIIKLNQAGTVTETIETCQLAKQNNWLLIPSHRGGGETTDTFMVDLAVATSAAYLKVGPTQPERTIKYDRLIEIERGYLR